jgi:hypothetical protein
MVGLGFHRRYCKILVLRFSHPRWLVSDKDLWIPLL